MKNLLATLAIAGLSTVSLAQAGVEATKTADANFFAGTSASIWNYLSTDSESQQVSFSIEPHLNINVGGLFNLDVNASMDAYSDGEAKALFEDVVPKLYAFKSFSILGGKLMLNPALEAELPTSGLSVQIEPHLEVVVPIAKISTAKGTVSPYLYGYYETAFSASKVETEVEQISNDFEDDQERRSFSALPIAQQEAEIEKVTAKYRPNSNPVGTYSRIAVAYEPNAVKGLKLSAMTNFTANYNNSYIIDKNDRVLTNNKEWDVKTQPRLRLDYKISDKLALRTDLSVNMTGLFEDLNDSAPVTLGNRLIITLF